MLAAPTLNFEPECRQPDDPTVAELLSLMRSPDEEERDDALASLSEIVGSAYGDDGAAIGEAVRANGGPAILTWLLADPDPYIQQLALMVLGNLCSDSVDSYSGLTKLALLGCGGARAVLSCVHTEEPAVLVFACGALQNLCYERGWAELVVVHNVHRRLESLLQHGDQMVVRYASGTLKNITHALVDGPDLAAALSADALEAVRERGMVKRREEFVRARARALLCAAVAAIPMCEREERHASGEERRRRAQQLLLAQGDSSPRAS